VLEALEQNRSPVVLTARRDHFEYLQNRFSRFMRNLIVLRGGISTGEREAVESALRAADNQERLILATRRYVGEGYDDQRLDALFLTMPISWKGTSAHMLAVCTASMTERLRFSSSTMLMNWSSCWRAWQQSGEQEIGRSATQLISPPLQ
jgi:hypothetical protein